MKKVALLFPGQGSQYAGMGKKIWEKYTEAKQVFEEANDILGFDLKNLCFEGSLEELTRTENTQPAILTASIAAFRVYMKEYGIKPQFCAGHSLGEISALTCAGAVRFAEALKIVRQRGIFMQEAAEFGTGSMSAISGIDRKMIEDECSKVSTPEHVVVISNYNAPDQTVISGHKDAVAEVSGILASKGARTVALKVSAPFHSPLMQPAADKFLLELKKYTYGKIDMPVISNIDALPYENEEKIIERLTLQLTKPVRWQESMEYLMKQNIETAVEIGPHTVLKNLMKKNQPTIKTYAFDKDEDEAPLLKELLPSDINKGIGTGFKHTIVTKCIQITVCTRNRNWDNDEYQKGVVEPYRRIQKMQEEIEKEGREPTISEMKQSLDMLRSVFITKKVPFDEQVERFNEVFNATGTGYLFPDFEMPA